MTSYFVKLGVERVKQVEKTNYDLYNFWLTQYKREP